MKLEYGNRTLWIQDTLRTHKIHTEVSGQGAITSKIKHAVKLKISPARLAQLLQPSLAFFLPCSQWRRYTYAVIGCKVKNANEGCNSCASLAGLVLSFIACFILLVIAPLAYNCGHGSECPDDWDVLRVKILWNWVLSVPCILLGPNCLGSEVSSRGRCIPVIFSFIVSNSENVITDQLIIKWISCMCMHRAVFVIFWWGSVIRHQCYATKSKVM